MDRAEDRRGRPHEDGRSESAASEEPDEPQPRTASDEEFQAAMDYVFERRGPAFKALADCDRGCADGPPGET